KAPVVVHAVKKRAGDVIVALRKPIKSAAQIPVAESPTPAFIRREGELMKREIQFANVDVVAHLGVQREPRARLDREVGVKIAERLLQAERFVEIGEIGWILARREPPVQQHVPIEQIVELSVAPGLERVAQAEANHVLAVNRINVV